MTPSIPTDTSDFAVANQRNLRRLVVSVQASVNTLNLLIAICDNPVYRDELIQTYETELTAKGFTCYQIQLDRQQPSLKQSLLDWKAQLPSDQSEPPKLVTVRGGDELLGVRLQQPKSAQEKFFFSVQWTREGLREFHVPVVLWVTQAVAQGLAQQAPDFWSWRGGVFEFHQPLAWQVPTQPLPIEPSPDSTREPLADPADLEQQIAALQTQDPDSPLLASLYQSLGKTYYQRLKQGIAVNRLQEEEKAIAALQAAISRQEASNDLLPLATSLNNLAHLYDSQGRYAEAEPLYVRSLSIDEQQLGADHPDVATSLNNLAALYDSQGRYAEAEQLLVRSLSIKEQQLGADHPDVATSLNNLALLHKSQGRYAEAEQLYGRSLSIREQQLGANHPDVAISLNNLAGLYQAQGRYAEAEPLYLRALDILPNALEEDHPNTRTVLNNFLTFLFQVIQAGQTAQLSQHPLTQELLRQLKGGDANA